MYDGMISFTVPYDVLALVVDGLITSGDIAEVRESLSRFLRLYARYLLYCRDRCRIVVKHIRLIVWHFERYVFDCESPVFKIRVFSYVVCAVLVGEAAVDASEPADVVVVVIAELYLVPAYRARHRDVAVVFREAAAVLSRSESYDSRRLLSERVCPWLVRVQEESHVKLFNYL